MHLLAGLKANRLARRNWDLLTRAWIAPHAAFPRLDDEDAEASQLDAIAARERCLHRLKQRVHRLFGFQLGHAGSIGYAVDNIYFDQSSWPPFVVVPPTLGLRIKAAMIESADKGSQLMSEAAYVRILLSLIDTIAIPPTSLKHPPSTNTES